MVVWSPFPKQMVYARGPSQPTSRDICIRSAERLKRSTHLRRTGHSTQEGYGYGSKPWYLVNPKIAGKWMFIPQKNVFIGIDPYPCVRICQDLSLCITFSSCLDLPFLAFEKSPYVWHVEMILSSRPKPGFLSCFFNH